MLIRALIMNHKDSHIANISLRDIDEILASARDGGSGSKCQKIGDLQFVLNELKLSITIDANMSYWIQFIAGIIRNVTILIGHFTLNLTVYNTVSIEKKLLKYIHRYSAKDVSSDALQKIIKFNIIPISAESKLELQKLKQTSNELITTMFSNFINGTSDKIDIVVTEFGGILYDDLLKYFALKRLHMDNAILVDSKCHQIFICVDGLTYVPNAVKLCQISEKYPDFTFFVRVSESDSSEQVKQIIIAKNIHQVSSIAEHCKSIVDAYTKIYLVETINALPHTKLGDDVLKTNPKRIVFMFGSECFGVTDECLQFVNSHSNSQNILIRSNSPYFHENNHSNHIRMQNYSMNLTSCIITVLAGFS
jgi:hypothetical protein